MRDRRGEVVLHAHELFGALGVVAIDAPGPPLHLELPEQHADEEPDGDRRDDQSQASLGIRHARGLRLLSDFGVDLRLETSESTLDLLAQVGGNPTVVGGGADECPCRVANVREVQRANAGACGRIVLPDEPKRRVRHL